MSSSFSPSFSSKPEPSQTMKKTPSGIFHLARDGVLRSFDGRGRVIDCKRLTVEEIGRYVEPWKSKDKRAGPGDDDDDDDDAIWKNIDTKKLLTEQEMWDPRDDLLAELVLDKRRIAAATPTAQEANANASAPLAS